MNTGPGVRKWRNRMGLTQVQAAEALGVCESLMRRYERGQGPDGRELTPPRTVRLAMAALRKKLQPQRL